MSKNTEIHRLETALASLAAVLVETTIAKVREQIPRPNPAPPAQYAADPIRALMTKKDVQAYLGLSSRTVQNLMKSRSLPYIKLGKSVRFMLVDIENHLKRRHRVANGQYD